MESTEAKLTVNRHVEETFLLNMASLKLNKQ